MTTTKKEYLENLIGTNVTIDKILCWSLAGIPNGLLTNNTKFLLPHINSPHFHTRAKKIGYSYTNIIQSYSKCNNDNLKFFNSNIENSIIFLSDGKCIVCPYLDNSNGNFSLVNVYENGSIEHAKFMKLFDEMYNSSNS
jgi:hypothetical protein